VQEEVQDNEAQLDVVVDDSIVLNPSVGSDAGMENDVDNMVVDQQININNGLVPGNNNVLHIGVVHTLLALCSLPQCFGTECWSLWCLIYMFLLLLSLCLLGLFSLLL
jgi:hypothetical protein